MAAGRLSQFPCSVVLTSSHHPPLGIAQRSRQLLAELQALPEDAGGRERRFALLESYLGLLEMLEVLEARQFHRLPAPLLGAAVNHEPGGGGSCVRHDAAPPPADRGQAIHFSRPV